MLSVLYSSTATGTMEQPDLVSLLHVSRVNNVRDGVTGLLLFNDGRFLQMLEGPVGAVREGMSRIAADPRHRDLDILLERDIAQREFPDWTMGFRSLSSEPRPELPGYRRSLASLFTAQSDDYQSRLPLFRQMMSWFMTHPDEVQT